MFLKPIDLAVYNHKEHDSSSSSRRMWKKENQRCYCNHCRIQRSRRRRKKIGTKTKRHRHTKYDVKVIGPNCLGVMNLETKKTMMNSTFLKITPKSGQIALVSQSGAICAALVEGRKCTGELDFSAVVSMGKQSRYGQKLIY